MLQILNPKFDSKLTNLIIDLDHLRRKQLGGSTHPHIFFQIKEIFHLLESVGSARIEGNRTTIAEFIETKIQDGRATEENIIEIQNVERAMDFIDQNIEHNSIDRAFLAELHKIVVKDLTHEGDPTPGVYRKTNVHIERSKHIPPDFTQVEGLMSELVEFINSDLDAKYDLLKTALAHHRYVWIHPFRNGNGRTVRLLTYAMLVKQGFNVKQGRIINPTAVFCNDRNQYYDHLSLADSETEEGKTAWCEYVLSGLQQEIQKIDRLLDYTYLSTKILLPAIAHALERKFITNDEAKVLNVAIREQLFQAGHIREIWPQKIPAEISRVIGRLRKQGMVTSTPKQPRTYYIQFINNYLLRSVIHTLGENGFLPVKD